MRIFMENETDQSLPFPVEETVELVCGAVLEEEGCPYEADRKSTRLNSSHIH